MESGESVHMDDRTVTADEMVTVYFCLLCEYWLLSKNLKIKIHRNIVLPVVLYGCETWSLTLIFC